MHARQRSRTELRGAPDRERERKEGHEEEDEVREAVAVAPRQRKGQPVVHAQHRVLLGRKHLQRRNRFPGTFAANQ